MPGLFLSYMCTQDAHPVRWDCIHANFPVCNPKNLVLVPPVHKLRAIGVWNPQFHGDSLIGSIENCNHHLAVQLPAESQLLGLDGKLPVAS